MSHLSNDMWIIYFLLHLTILSIDNYQENRERKRKKWRTGSMTIVIKDGYINTVRWLSGGENFDTLNLLICQPLLSKPYSYTYK